MRKTYDDGGVVEGTPEEIRAYDNQRAGAVVLPLAPGDPIGGGPYWPAPQAPGRFNPVAAAEEIEAKERLAVHVDRLWGDGSVN